MFDPRSPYHRRMWHYESQNPLSVAQLVALGSLDARTAALLWLLIDQHRSLIVSGPTDPTPGVGKTTTLNALLGFLPAGSTLVYTAGMYEDFDFTDVVAPETTCVLANEVSNHLPIYMWDDHARKLLQMPEDGFAVATSCHADTISDVLEMLAVDLKLPAEAIRRLGVIVNIGLVGTRWPPSRRFLTVNYTRPVAPAKGERAEYGVSLLPLATWDAATDTFTPATDAALDELAGILSMDRDELTQTLEARTQSIAALSQGRGAGLRRMREAVDAFAAGDTEDASTDSAEDAAE